MKDEEEVEQEAPLARWTGIVPPASLTTTTGKQRFAVTIKLAEKSPKTASNFTKEMNDALKIKVDNTRGCKLTAQFVLVDSERTRLQRRKFFHVQRGAHLFEFSQRARACGQRNFCRA